MGKDNNKKRRIPVPSFSCVTPSQPKEESSPQKKQKETKDTSSNTTAAKTLCLVQTEAALHVQQARSRSSFLRLDDFYKLARQLNLVSPSPQQQQQDLSLTEQLLLDLLCTGSPSLYDLTQNDNDQWCLQLVEFKGSRMQELRQLMNNREEQVHPKYQDFLDIIRQHRDSTNKKAVTPKQPQVDNKTVQQRQDDTANKTPEKVIVEPFIHKDMTLEQRVAARAQARQEREAEAKAVASTSKQDFTHLLRLADALWSHSRHLLRKFPTQKPKQIVMTVQDVVKLFSSSLVVGTRASRKALLQALGELQLIAPEWISSSSPNFNNKNTTVWLMTTVDYPSIRTKLGGVTTANKKRPIMESITKQDAKIPPRVSMSPASTTTTTPLAKKQRTDGVRTLPERLAKKRPAPLDDSHLDAKRSPTRKKRGLRINPNLILTDSDHNGGTVIRPTIQDSPRGLKRLFSQLNSGQRI